jgi:hypothetical protein
LDDFRIWKIMLELSLVGAHSVSIVIKLISLGSETYS